MGIVAEMYLRLWIYFRYRYFFNDPKKAINDKTGFHDEIYEYNFLFIVIGTWLFIKYRLL